MNHTIIFNDNTKSNLLGYNYYESGLNSIINVDNFNYESSFNKNFIEVDLNQTGGETRINTLNLTKNNEHVDNNI